MKTKKTKVVKDRWGGLFALEIEDLKKLRKVIDEFIRNHENNQSV